MKNQNDTPLKPGKLPTALLSRLLDKYTKPIPGLITGPGIGLDAAVIDAGIQDGYLLAKSDPITFTATDIGYYAVTVNANDIACMGGTPKWFLATIILPDTAAYADVEAIFRSLADTCETLGVTLAGGHTEVTRGLDRPLVVGHMLGLVPRDGLITAAGAKTGDSVVLTKGIAIEAVSIIAREKAAELRKDYSQEYVDECAGYIHSPGISIVKDARVAVKAGGVHAMHDPTEGGLATGLYELALASGVGIEIDEHYIPVLPDADRLLKRYGLDPLGSIASGALIICAPRPDAERIVQELGWEGIYATIIGRVTDKFEGVRLVSFGQYTDMPVFARDEITRIFEG